VGGGLLSGSHDYVEGTVGVDREFAIHGPTDDILEPVRLLRENEGTREVPLRVDSEDHYPYAGFLHTLSLETTEKGKLLIQRAGSTLRVRGAREHMVALSEDIRYAARLVCERSGERHVDDVIVEMRNEPYTDANSGFLSVEVYEAIQDPDKLRQKSGREDSNLRPPRPERGALPGCATSRLDGHYSSEHPAFDPGTTAAIFVRSTSQEAEGVRQGAC
jgi:hypothetical protein